MAHNHHKGEKWVSKEISRKNLNNKLLNLKGKKTIRE